MSIPLHQEIDTRRLARTVFKSGATNGPQRYQEPKEVIEYYDGASTPDNVRPVLSAALMKSADESLDPSETMTWFLSLTDCFFPGLTAKSLHGLQTITLKPTNLAENDLTVLRGDGPTTRQLSLLNAPISTDEYMSSATDSALYGVYLSLLFAIGKTPTEQNLTAFTVNRPKAYLGRLNVTDTPRCLDAGHMPTLAAYQSVNGAFNAHLEVRRLFVSELVKWTGAVNLTPKVGAAVTIIRLWETAGMAHVMLIRNLIEGYADVLRRLKPLYSEISRFLTEYELASSSPTMGLSYFKVLEGDRRSALFSRDYPELLKLAREMASRQDARFRQYANALGGSAYLSSFERIAKQLSIPLPGDLAPDAVDVITPMA